MNKQVYRILEISGADWTGPGEGGGLGRASLPYLYLQTKDLRCLP